MEDGELIVLCVKGLFKLCDKVRIMDKEINYIQNKINKTESEILDKRLELEDLQRILKRLE